MPKADVAAALATPYDQPLVFRTEVRPYLYVASAGLLVLGLLFIGYAMTVPDVGFMGVIISAVGVFMLFVAWVNFRATRGGYPHLILLRHRLTVQSSDAVRRDLDLGALGATEIKILTAPRSGERLYLCFLPLPGAKHTPRWFAAPKLQPYAEAILLNGYVGTNIKAAKDIQQVIDVRRAAPRQDIALPPPPDRTRARLRLVVTAAVFAAVWVAIVWRSLLP